MISAAGFIIEHGIFLCQVMFKESFAELSLETALLVPGIGRHPGRSSSDSFFPACGTAAAALKTSLCFPGFRSGPVTSKVNVDNHAYV